MNYDDTRALMDATMKRMTRELSERIYNDITTTSPLVAFLIRDMPPVKPAPWHVRVIRRVRWWAGDRLYRLACWIGGETYGNEE
jgi:hypothetical protein